MRDTKSPQTVGQALDYCCSALRDSDVYFGHGTDNAWDEAVQMVLSVTALPLDSGDGVLPHPVDQSAVQRIDELLERRIVGHIPLPYLLGKAWFAGLEFNCDPRAIIPRSPLAELILNGFAPWYCGPGPYRILDLCCGGGAIGLAAAHYFPEARVDLLDIDRGALDLAEENARLLGVQERVEIRQSNLFEGLHRQPYDLILSNPPYVNQQDLAAMPAEYLHEPSLALGSGPDGLELTRRILAQAGDYLADKGLLLVEVGNSESALQAAYPDVPFTWLEFEHGGHGVFSITAQEWQDYSASWR